jgi:hypothetical protein
MSDTSLAELHDDLRSAHALLDGLRQGEEKRLAICNEIRADRSSAIRLMIFIARSAVRARIIATTIA